MPACNSFFKSLFRLISSEDQSAFCPVALQRTKTYRDLRVVSRYLETHNSVPAELVRVERVYLVLQCHLDVDFRYDSYSQGSPLDLQYVSKTCVCMKPP